MYVLKNLFKICTHTLKKYRYWDNFYYLDSNYSIQLDILPPLLFRYIIISMQNNPSQRQRPIKSSVSFPKQYPHTNNHTQSQIIYQSTFESSDSNFQFLNSIQKGNLSNSMVIEERVNELRKKQIENDKNTMGKLKSPNFQAYKAKNTSIFMNKKGQSDNQQNSDWKSIKSQPKPIKIQLNQVRKCSKIKKIKKIKKQKQFINPSLINSQILYYLPDNFRPWVSEIPQDEIAGLYREIMKEKRYFEYKEHKFEQIEKQKQTNIPPQYKLPDERKQILSVINLLSSQSQASQEIINNKMIKQQFGAHNKRNLKFEATKDSLQEQKKKGIPLNLIHVIKQFKIMIQPLQSSKNLGEN